MLFEENEHTELKEKVAQDFAKEVVAFANTHGGTIYVGVNDSGVAVGVENADETILQIKNMIRDSIKPDVMMFVRFSSFSESGKSIVSVSVQTGTDKPYYLAAKGLKPSGVYVRSGTSSDPSTDTAIRKMIKETDGDSFEEMRSPEQQLTFDSAENEFEQYGVDFGDTQKRTLGLINADGIYTNLALLLSDECPHTLKAATFQGTDRTEFRDRREFDGSLFRQLEGAYEYIDLRNRIHSSFEGLRRTDMRDYPEEALREAMLNSFVHRDYSFSASTLISVYDDRIEFVSIGGLLSGVSQSDIMIGLSVCRNPKLAGVFYRLHLIEAYGTGMPKIIDAYKGFERQPKIEVTDNAFKITLPNLNYEAVKQSETKPSHKGSDKIITEYVKKNGYITRAGADELLGVSSSTSSRLLRGMVKSGILKLDGKGNKTKYVLK